MIKKIKSIKIKKLFKKHIPVCTPMYHMMKFTALVLDEPYLDAHNIARQHCVKFIFKNKHSLLYVEAFVFVYVLIVLGIFLLRLKL